MNINISMRSFLIAAALILLAVFVTNLFGIIMTFFLAFILFAGLKPLVDRLDNAGWNRGIAVATVYTLLFSLIILIIYFIATQVVGQIRVVIENINIQSETIISITDQFFPEFSDEVANAINDIERFARDPELLRKLSSSEYFAQIISSLGNLGAQSFRFVGGVVGGVFSIVMIFFLSTYMVLPKKDFYFGLLSMMPNQINETLSPIIKKIRTGLGAWLAGMLFLMFVIGMGTYIIVLLPSLFVDGYKLGQLAILLALIAGILEAIPNIGPMLGLVVVVGFAILVGTPLGVIVYLIIAFFILQQLEGLFLVPLVMKKAIDIHPVVSILAVLAGFELTGSPIGALLAIPVAGIIQIFVIEILQVWKKEQEMKVEKK